MYWSRFNYIEHLLSHAWPANGSRHFSAIYPGTRYSHAYTTHRSVDKFDNYSRDEQWGSGRGGDRATEAVRGNSRMIIVLIRWSTMIISHNVCYSSRTSVVEVCAFKPNCREIIIIWPITHAPKFQSLYRNNSAVNCLISVKFGMRVRYVSAEDARRIKSTYHEIQVGGSPPNFKSSSRCTSAANCPISVIFGTELDQVTPMHFTTNVQGQVSKVKVTAWKRRLIAKLLLHVRNSKSLNLMTVSDLRSEAGK